MDDYVQTTDDNGGVHINSGIPNKAFYETAIRLGTDVAGEIWVEALYELQPDSDFQALADATYAVAETLYDADSAEQNAVKDAWASVGIMVNNP
jgi:Zn-dependent metalloprotease